MVTKSYRAVQCSVPKYSPTPLNRAKQANFQCSQQRLKTRIPVQVFLPASTRHKAVSIRNSNYVLLISMGRKAGHHFIFPVGIWKPRTLVRFGKKGVTKCIIRITGQHFLEIQNA